MRHEADLERAPILTEASLPSDQMAMYRCPANIVRAQDSHTVTEGLTICVCGGVCVYVYVHTCMRVYYVICDLCQLGVSLRDTTIRV